MYRLRRWRMEVKASRESILAELARRRAVSCLGTALESYSSYYRPDEVSFYSIDLPGDESSDRLRKWFQVLGPGVARVRCYHLDSRKHGRREAASGDWKQVVKRLERIGFLERSGIHVRTTKIQTVIDLFCDGKAFAARELLRELWGIDV